MSTLVSSGDFIRSRETNAKSEPLNLKLSSELKL